ncbi:MAG: amidohydrolase/deacetylase family metallohydrolase, partial [Cyclobacteriaceae bacterium]|nr:amidohydrolase/deacetylase family metallohydrolase [Cyclobacteriaceae bacterium]
PAQYIKRTDLGHLTVGAVADITISKLQKGDFGFIDSKGLRMKGTQKLECELTVREGIVVYDLNGISRPLWNK